MTNEFNDYYLWSFIWFLFGKCLFPLWLWHFSNVTTNK